LSFLSFYVFDILHNASLLIADLYAKPVASPADSAVKNNPMKPLSSWGRGNTATPNPTTKSSGKVDQIQRTASFEQFQKLAKEKEEKVSIEPIKLFYS